MSKRFGRNQKRRMREEIAAVSAERDSLREWLNQEIALGARNRQIVDETAQVLGRRFMTLEPEVVEVQALDQLAHGWRAHFMPKLQPYDMTNATPSYETMMEVLLPVLYGSVFADELGRHIHIRFTYAGQDVGYAIGLNSLRMLPPEAAARRISQEMGRFLCAELAKPVELGR
ncbi:hypothetical protein [Marinobacter salarius]|uniref:hypothetical protein n=1 Tax=Marinobacter salarius TaxID=1420917 RepID=UPI003D09FEF7